MFVDYKDIDQIRSALVTLRDDSELLRRLGENHGGTVVLPIVNLVNSECASVAEG